MTVILAFMGVGIFLSLVVAHIASRFSEKYLWPVYDIESDLELADRLERDQRYAKLL